MKITSFATQAGAMATLFALLATSAGAQSTGTQSNSAPNTVDQQFVTQAIKGGDQEVDQAQAELNSTTDPSVKMFAQRMITDHTAANGQIAAVAKNLNISYPQSHIQTSNAGSNPDAQSPTGTPPPAATKPNPATAMPPHDYMQQEVQDHQQTIALFENEAKNGGSDQLRTVAAQTLPTLRQHLAMAQQYANTGRITMPAPAPQTPGSPPR